MTEWGGEKLLIGAGAVTWGVVGAPVLVSFLARREPFDATDLAWCAAYVAFAVAFWIGTRMPGTPRRPTRARAAALGVQTAAALVLLGLAKSGLEGALLCIVAGEAPLVLGEATGIAWVGAQTAAMLAVLLASTSARYAVLTTGIYAAFQLFAASAARIAAREAAGRQELARVHAELLATQQLLADSARTAERLRIARDLHDALGHHMTALSLQLEVARNVAEGSAREPVEQAHALTKTLLGELRSVVGEMREDQPIDLARALRTLVAGVPWPRIHLEIAPELQVEAAVAHTIFRCAQEALTNAVRHADANNVFLAIEEKDGAISLVARDDGRGAASVKAGHGLTGLRERVESLGGQVEVDAKPGKGVTLRALLPARGAAL